MTPAPEGRIELRNWNDRYDVLPGWQERLAQTPEEKPRNVRGEERKDRMTDVIVVAAIVVIALVWSRSGGG